MVEAAEQELVRLARDGDTDALEALLVRCQPRVYRFGMKLCRNPEDASDILQDTLLAMARTVRDFRGASSLSTWLYTIARSFCIKKRRRSKYAPAASLSLEQLTEAERDGIAAPVLDPEEQASRRELGAAVDAAIGLLEPIYREALVLRDVEGLTAAETAEVLGISVPAVKSRLHRARVSLRALVAPALEAPAGPPPGSGCPDVLTLFSQHVEGDLSAELCGEMERHIEECGHCRGACDSLKRTLALCRDAPAPELPADVRRSVRAALHSFLAGNA